MVIIPFVLNLPWTIVGLFLALVSFPHSIRWNKNPTAFVIKIKSAWWGRKGTRAAAIGHVVLLTPKVENKDLEHELVHVQQSMREPFIHPFLYQVESIRKGYRNNKYEEEAYRLAGNVYKGK